MTISTFMLILRAALLCLSFTGLCASARVLLKLNRFIAPCFTACSIITVLMLCGMLRVLGAGVILLYAAGFAGFVYVYLIKKIRPDFPLIGLFAALAGYLCWRFLPCHLYLTDDFSHWALVARHLLESDAFPDASSALVTFRSYPLGAACFIYYACRAPGGGEALWLVAQNMLLAFMILPLLANMGGNTRWLAPVAPVIFLVMFKSDRPLLTLVVDWLLCGVGIGMAASVVYYRENPRKALLAVLPCMLACIWLKSSGVFFSVCTAVLLAWTAGRSQGHSYGRKILILTLLACAAAFLAWNLHVKLTFPDGPDTKHAVSLDAYARRASDKDHFTVLTIAAKMVLAWLRPARYQIYALLFMALCFAVVLFALKRNPARRSLCVGTLKALAACIAVYAVWYAMIFAMYIFSMPIDEARRLAAIERYDSTGVVYMLGLACTVMLRFLSHYESVFNRAERKAVCAAIAMAVAGLISAPMLDMEMHGESIPGFYADLFSRDASLSSYRETPQSLLAARDIPAENGRYIICLGAHATHNPVTLTGYTSKYELRTPGIAVLMRCTAEKYADAPYMYRNMQEWLYLPDPIPKIAEEIDQCDAILVYEEDPVFLQQLDEFLSGYAGDTPVYYAYR